MASATDSNRSSTGFRRLLHLKKRSDSQAPPELNPLISAPPPSVKKKGFASAAFRGLCCASSTSSQAFTPTAAAAAVRSSADWQGKRSRRRRAKQKKKERRSPDAADVWCAPGIAFAADPPVDCVVSRYQMAGRGRSDSERVRREQRHFLFRQGANQEHFLSFMDSPSTVDAPLFGSDPLPSGSLRRLRGYRRSPGGLEELAMFQRRFLFGAMDVYDQYKDMRIDVDRMSYEELLELGDRIGYVSTGLREEEIFCCLRETKHSLLNASPPFRYSELERKCSICQEEYEVRDEMGRLECGHSYHMYCIKQWLLRKNACPVCKAAATRS